MKKISVEEFWKNYLKSSGKDPSTGYTSELSFGDDDESSSLNILEILSGKRTAFSSSYYAFEIDREPLPKKGNLYVLTDWLDNPYAVLETKDVTTLPFNMIPWSLAQKENEAESLDEWKEVKAEFFEYDADVMGYNFSPEMPVVFEEFVVIYRNPEACGL